MGKHCLQLVVTLLPLMHGNFSNKLTRKIHAAQLVFSIIFKMVDKKRMHASNVSCTDF